MKTLAIAAALLLSLPLEAAGVGVTDAWLAAQAHDPAFAAAQAKRAAGQAQRAQARALWLPTLAALGSTGRVDLDSRTQGAYFAAPGFGSTGGVDFRSSLNGGTATRWSLYAEQPLFDAARHADAGAARNAAGIAEAQYRQAQQQLITRTTRAYFDVLNARAQQQALQRLHAAAERARATSQARYEAGDIAVTDMREAQAQADAVAVQELDARSTGTLNEAAFSDLTGLDAAGVGPVPADATDKLPASDSLDEWTQRALRGSPQLTMTRLARENAAAQVGRYGAFDSLRLSLVAQTGRDFLTGSGDFGASEIAQRQTSIGLQASLPLFTGGMRSAQRHEARALEQQAAAELDGATLQLRQQTRSAWLALATAAARVQALGRLRISTAGRRDATRLGAEIGERTALELLSAEGDCLRAEADYQRAQGDWFMADLQLKALTGALGEADLRAIDQRLGIKPGNAPGIAPGSGQ